MLHYINTDIVFQEFPDEVPLAINVSGCPCHCPGCHSQFLWADRGHDLTTEALSALIHDAKDTITCVGFMGGDGDPAEVDRLAEHVRQNHEGLKVGWYTGRTAISPLIDQQRHCVIESVHPSPLSANRGGWFGQHQFSRCNAYLTSCGAQPIEW